MIGRRAFSVVGLIWLGTAYQTLCVIRRVGLTVSGVNWKLFTARRNASAVYAVVMCLSVCLSVRDTPVLYQNG